MAQTREAPVLDFRAADILDDLGDATADQLDDLPFGVVRMDRQGIVADYNRFESNLSGLTPDRVIGKNFFEQVAPCTNNFMVASRYGEDSLDEQLDYVFTYKMKPTKVRLRMLKSPASGHQYLLVEKT